MTDEQPGGIIDSQTLVQADLAQHYRAQRRISAAIVIGLAAICLTLAIVTDLYRELLADAEATATQLQQKLTEVTHDRDVLRERVIAYEQQCPASPGMLAPGVSGGGAMPSAQKSATAALADITRLQKEMVLTQRMLVSCLERLQTPSFARFEAQR